MSDEWRDTDRPDNLFKPVDDDRDYGAHGNFDARASDDSMYWQLDRHRGVAAGAVAAIAAMVGFGLLRSRH